MKLQALFDTDPLALGALAGLGVTIVVTIALFWFLLSHKDQRKA
jgi:hypothetical protein